MPPSTITKSTAQPARTAKHSATSKASGITLKKQKSAHLTPSTLPPASKVSTGAASLSDATVIVTRPKLAEGDVQGALGWYLSLWYHPTCGGAPVAFIDGCIVCDMCNYSRLATAGRNLGDLLSDSFFLTKKGNPAWFV